MVWRAEIGAGFSSVSTSDGLVFAFGNVADEDLVSALDAENGQIRWRFAARTFTASPNKPWLWRPAPCKPAAVAHEQT